MSIQKIIARLAETAAAPADVAKALAFLKDLTGLKDLKVVRSYEGYITFSSAKGKQDRVTLGKILSGLKERFGKIKLDSHRSDRGVFDVTYDFKGPNGHSRVAVSKDPEDSFITISLMDFSQQD